MHLSIDILILIGKGRHSTCLIGLWNIHNMRSLNGPFTFPQRLPEWYTAAPFRNSWKSHPSNNCDIMYIYRLWYVLTVYNALHVLFLSQKLNTIHFKKNYCPPIVFYLIPLYAHSRFLNLSYYYYYFYYCFYVEQ